MLEGNEMREITYRQALNEALDEEMQRDEKVFIFGEDVAIYGGAYGVTAGLWKKYGDEKVIDTPISEEVIYGSAVGAALAGMRPIVEFHFADFLFTGMDAVVNQIMKIRYMSGGQRPLPIILRGPDGAAKAAAAQHSQSIETIFMHIPGIKVVIPSTPYDAKGLLKSSIRDDNPVMFIELGSVEENWRDSRAAQAVVHSIVDLIENYPKIKDKYIPVSGYGGTHYCPRFNQIQLNTNYAVGHVIPKYAFEEGVDEKMIFEAINKTVPKPDFVIIDWKGITKAHKDFLVEVLEKNKIPYQKARNVLKNS